MHEPGYLVVHEQRLLILDTADADSKLHRHHCNCTIQRRRSAASQHQVRWQDPGQEHDFEPQVHHLWHSHDAKVARPTGKRLQRLRPRRAKKALDGKNICRINGAKATCRQEFFKSPARESAQMQAVVTFSRGNLALPCPDRARLQGVGRGPGSRVQFARAQLVITHERAARQQEHGYTTGCPARLPPTRQGGAQAAVLCASSSKCETSQ